MTNPPTTNPLKKLLGGRNLFLIGMMGSGKSSTGYPLAKKLEYGFVDTDSVIEKVSAKSIKQIFHEDGEKNFRTIESQVLHAIGHHHSLVVATGGGLVTNPENWGTLHLGIVIWLNPSLNQLFKRLEVDPNQRPLLNQEDPKRTLRELMDNRKKFYVESDLELQVNEMQTPSEVANNILEKLPSIITTPEVPIALQTTEE